MASATELIIQFKIISLSDHETKKIQSASLNRAAFLPKIVLKLATDSWDFPVHQRNKWGPSVVSIANWVAIVAIHGMPSWLATKPLQTSYKISNDNIRAIFCHSFNNWSEARLIKSILAESWCDRADIILIADHYLRHVQNPLCDFLILNYIVPQPSSANGYFEDQNKRILYRGLLSKGINKFIVGYKCPHLKGQLQHQF